jgi:hypothetical protein
MFACANSPKLRRTNPELAQFVPKREKRHLPDDVRVFAFHSIGDRSRSAGLAGLLTGVDTDAPGRQLFSETTFPPFGFVLTPGSPPPDERLADITYFADRRYTDSPERQRQTACVALGKRRERTYAFDAHANIADTQKWIPKR